MSQDKPKPDRHKSTFVVRLPEEYREKLKVLTDRTRRKYTAEVQIALDKHLAFEGGDGSTEATGPRGRRH